MIRARACLLFVISCWWCAVSGAEESIPRAEHPTPDAVRAHWLNLNGPWQFRLDPKDEGRGAGWSAPVAEGFDRTITVPFGWESELSGIHRTDYRGVAWYRRTFRIPDDFPKSERVWLRFGAVDWRADVWVNGRHVAEHEGGYSPFSTDITEAIKPGAPAVITVRAFDATDPSLPTGKQVGWYTPTSGIWQTVWLESRPRAHVASFTATSKLEPGYGGVSYRIRLAGLTPGKPYTISVRSKGQVSGVTFTPDSERSEQNPGGPGWRDPKLWTPETPHLHDVTLELKGPDGQVDKVESYFGIRTISRGRYGPAPYERLLLNGKPIYLRAALDQSFNPKGIYTAPTDDFLKHDIALAKSFGLNALRIHIKPDEPRRLYWADKLGILILEDMPNTWRQNDTSRRAWESTMREVVARDLNHPAIVAWVAFNETWGLGDPPQYKADRDTQAWVNRMVGEIRKLDPSRLVEDNSPCNFDHVENTDLNSWHFYIDDHDASRKHIDEVVARTEPGSGFNYCPGLKQATAPLINSEYGSISAGSGDRDISWGFRDLTTLLRRQPKIQGYVYTELDDIEWEHNGFVNYDRTPKHFGYDAFVKDMTVADLQGPDFIGYDAPPAIVAEPGEEITVPVFVSHYSELEEAPVFSWTFRQVFSFGNVQEIKSDVKGPIAWTPYGVSDLEPVRVRAPLGPCVGAIGLTLTDRKGRRIAANFVNVVVKGVQPRIELAPGEKKAVAIRFAPGDYARREWSGKAASPAGRAYGQGRGFYEYHLKLPESVTKAGPRAIALYVELASRAGGAKVDWPERRNREDYPQTDARSWPSTVRLLVNGVPIVRRVLPDDPADARGVPSHLARADQGSHGELYGLGGLLPEAVRKELAAGKPLVLRLEVPDDAPEAGGLCIFGAGRGAYPSDPTLLVSTNGPLPADLGVEPESPLTIDTIAPRHSNLVAPGDAEESPAATWAYTTTSPGDGWDQPGFDDHAWKKGRGGFGTSNTPSHRAGTHWGSPQVWLRTTVDLKRIAPKDVVTLHLFHDEDVEVFLNGKPLYKAKGFVTNYRDVVLDEARKALLHTGLNTIAVTCRQTSGGQGVDLGLALDRED